MATCAMCGGKDVTTSCPVCREVRYCDDTCRLADWSSGHARIAARQFCRQLALEGSPVFFLPEGEDTCRLSVTHEPACTSLSTRVRSACLATWANMSKALGLGNASTVTIDTLSAFCGLDSSSD